MKAKIDFLEKGSVCQNIHAPKPFQAYAKQFGQARKALYLVFLILFIFALTLLHNHVTKIWGIGLFYGGEITLWGWLGYEMVRGHRIAEFFDAMAKLLLVAVMIAMLLMFFALSGVVEVMVLSIVSTIYAGLTYIWLGTYAGLLYMLRFRSDKSSVLY